MVKAVNGNANNWISSSQQANNNGDVSSNERAQVSNGATQNDTPLGRINTTPLQQNARLAHQAAANESLRHPSNNEEDRLSQTSEESGWETVSEDGYESDRSAPEERTQRRQPSPRLSDTESDHADISSNGSDSEESDFSDNEDTPPKRKRQRAPAGGPGIPTDKMIEDDDGEYDDEDEELELEPVSLLDILFGGAEGMERGSGKVNKAEYLKASGLPEEKQEAHWNTVVKHFEAVVKNFSEKHHWIGEKMDEAFSNPNLTNTQKNEIFQEGRQLQAALSKFLDKAQANTQKDVDMTDAQADAKRPKKSNAAKSDASHASSAMETESNAGSEAQDEVILPFDTHSVSRLENGIRAFEKLLPEFKSGWLDPSQLTVGFDQVAGCEEPKRICKQVVDMLKNPEKYERLGATVPKGLLFDGPPGVGKTLLAKAIAKEAGVPFCSKAGSDFVEIYVGQGAKSIRDLIDQAKLRQPCIVFIDEIDALGRERSNDNNNRESDNTLNQLLVEMDGAKDKQPRILWIGATNRAELLDKALTRRLEKEVNFSSPGLEDRKKLFALYSKDRPMADDVDLEMMAALTRGFSGAEVSKLLNEAAIQTAYAGKDKIGQAELTKAHEEIHLGTANTSLTMTPLEKQKVAYHEAGHALVGHMLGYHPVFCITVTPRERALGLTTFMPEEDHANPTYDLLMSDLATCYGGRVAEGLIFGQGQISVGAHGDLDQARSIATNMVTKYGYTDDQRTMTGGSGTESANEIDKRVSDLMAEGQKKAQEVLTANRDKLDKLASILVKNNTIYRDKFLEIAGPSPVPHPGEAKPILMVTAD